MKDYSELIGEMQTDIKWIKEAVKELQDNNKWLSRLVIGTVITTIIASLFLLKK